MIMVDGILLNFVNRKCMATRGVSPSTWFHSFEKLFKNFSEQKYFYRFLIDFFLHLKAKGLF